MNCKASPSGKGAGDAPLSIGVRTGVFQEHGLEVELAPVEGGTGAIGRALAAGDVDFAVMPGVPLVQANLEGHELVELLSLVAVNLHGVIGGKDVTEPAKLKGKVIGTHGTGGQDSLLLRRALALWGLDREKDVTMQSVGDRPALWAALERGEIGAFCTTAPLTIQAATRGYPLLHKFWVPPTPYQLGAICTRKQLVQDNRELVRRFVRGICDSIRIFQNDPDLGEEHIRIMTEITDPLVLQLTYDEFAKQMRRYRPEPAALIPVMDELPGADRLNPEDMIDASFLDELDRAELPMVF
jgi:NitT/TauT family transport system substrate-binding protein